MPRLLPPVSSSGVPAGTEGLRLYFFCKQSAMLPQPDCDLCWASGAIRGLCVEWINESINVGQFSPWRVGQGPEREAGFPAQDSRLTEG